MCPSGLIGLGSACQLDEREFGWCWERKLLGECVLSSEIRICAKENLLEEKGSSVAPSFFFFTFCSTFNTLLSTITNSFVNFGR